MFAQYDQQFVSTRWNFHNAGLTAAMPISATYQTSELANLRKTTLIEVIAIVTTKPGLRASVLSMFLEHVAAVQREKGCIEYRLGVDINDAPPAVTLLGADTFLVLEKWNSREELAAHTTSAQHNEHQLRVGHTLASHEIHVLESIQAKRASPIHGGSELKNHFPAALPGRI